MKPENEIKKLADSMMQKYPILAGCLHEVAFVAKHGAEDALYKNLGQFTSRLVEEARQQHDTRQD